MAIATGRAHYKAINFMCEICLKNKVCNGGHSLVVPYDNNEVYGKDFLFLK